MLDKVTEELDELANAASKEQQVEEFGDLLLNIANYARYLSIDAEEALRLASRKFRRRFEAVESQAGAQPMTELSREQLMTMWDAAKAAEGGPVTGNK